jgi:hypothetical protein
LSSKSKPKSLVKLCIWASGPCAARHMTCEGWSWSCCPPRSHPPPALVQQAKKTTQLLAALYISCTSHSAPPSFQFSTSSSSTLSSALSHSTTAPAPSRHVPKYPTAALCDLRHCPRYVAVSIACCVQYARWTQRLHSHTSSMESPPQALRFPGHNQPEQHSHAVPPPHAGKPTHSATCP